MGCFMIEFQMVNNFRKTFSYFFRI